MVVLTFCPSRGLYLTVLRRMGQKTRFFKNEPRKLLKTPGWPQKTNLNEPKNEAGKLLKTGSCGKNEAKNEPGHVVENK